MPLPVLSCSLRSWSCFSNRPSTGMFSKTRVIEAGLVVIETGLVVPRRSPIATQKRTQERRASKNRCARCGSQKVCASPIVANFKVEVFLLRHVRKSKLELLGLPENIDGLVHARCLYKTKDQRQRYHPRRDEKMITRIF